MLLAGKASGGSAEPAANAVITGFENCVPIFSDPSISPAYTPNSQDPSHSGKVRGCL